MKKNYFLTLLLTLFISGLSFGQVIITELADPNNSAGARFVEIYNVSDSDVDLTDWELRRWTNANADPQGTGVDLTPIGTLTPGSFAIIAANGTTFASVYGINADIIGGTGGAVDSNGDDKIAIYDDSDTTIDIYGTPGVDSNNASSADNFEDGRAERAASVSSSNPVWTASEWNTDNDQGFGSGAQDAPGGFDPGAWIGTATGATISVGTGVTGLDYFEGSGPSDEGSFSVEGINLTEDVLVTAPTNFEISLNSAGTFTSSVTVTQSGGTASGTVYVKLVSGLSANTYTDNATVTSAVADNQTVSVSGTVTAADPQITVTAFLDDFNYVVSVGGPSSEDSFAVEGLFLTTDIIATAPANYEVSLASGAGFGSSVNITPSSGTIASTTIFVRLSESLSVGNYTGDITISSTGVADETITVNGNAYGAPTNSLVITGAYDGTLTGGTPKGIELYVLEDISNLSLYGVSSITNGAGTSAGNVEYNFPADAVTAGTYIYLATDSDQFTVFFGLAPTYDNGVVGINGDDSIELYENGQIIDTFGDVNKDGSGETWDYLDGWAYRKSTTGPEGTTFTSANWTYSGVGGLGGGTNNATANSPFPIGTYTAPTASVKNNIIEGFAIYPNPITNYTFTLTSASSEEKSVTVFNLLGKKVPETRFSGIKSDINVSAINAGIYILKVTESGKTATKKLVIR